MVYTIDKTNHLYAFETPDEMFGYWCWRVADAKDDDLGVVLVSDYEIGLMEFFRIVRDYRLDRLPTVNLNGKILLVLLPNAAKECGVNCKVRTIAEIAP